MFCEIFPLLFSIHRPALQLLTSEQFETPYILEIFFIFSLISYNQKIALIKSTYVLYIIQYEGKLFERVIEILVARSSF